MTDPGARAKRQSISTASKAGEITGLGLAARQGDTGALRLLADRSAPRFRAIIEDLLEQGSAPNLSPSQLQKAALAAFVDDPDVALTSRADIFDFVERVSREFIDTVIAYGDSLPPDSKAFRYLGRVFGQSAKAHDPVLLSRSISATALIDPRLSLLVRLRHVCDLNLTSAADWLGLPEADLQPGWTASMELLERVYQVAEKQRPLDLEALDRCLEDLYRDPDILTPVPVADDLESKTSASELVEALQAEVGKLKGELEAAQSRIAELEDRLAADAPDTSKTRQDIAGTLEPVFGMVSLDEVPLCTVASYEGMWEHLRTHYGQWLKCFGADRDYISLDQIRNHDPELVKKLTHRISRRRKKEIEEYGKPRTPRLTDIITSKLDRVNQSLPAKTFSELLEPGNKDLAQAAYSRLALHLRGK